MSEFMERCTERARQALVLAQEEARALKHNHIGTEHILLGLLREEEGLASRVLESLDITVERVRAQVVRGEEVTSGQIPFTPRAKKVLEMALHEALNLGHNYIGTEHILLALVCESEGVATRILLDFDADSENIRNEVIRMLSGPGSRRRSTLTEEPARKLTIGQQLDARFALFASDNKALRDGNSTLVELIFALERRVERLEERLQLAVEDEPVPE